MKDLLINKRQTYQKLIDQKEKDQMNKEKLELVIQCKFNSYI